MNLYSRCLPPIALELNPVCMRQSKENKTTATTTTTINRFVAIQNAVLEVSKATLRGVSRKQPSANAVRAIALQVSLVITGIRSGHLLDQFAPEPACLASFLARLKHLDAQLAVLYEETTQQTFFINVSLLQSRINQEDYPAWIATSAPPHRVRLS